MTTQDNNEAASAEGFSELVRDLYNFEGGRSFAARLEKLVEAASASQSSTPVPRVGGPDEAKTIDTLDFAKVLGVLLRADRKRIKAGALADSEWMTAYEAFVAYIDNFLAHVARQRQESAAVAEGVDTPEFRERFKYMLREEYAALVADVTALCAQQREAGRRDSRVELLDVLARLATVQQQLIDANAEIIAANAGMHPNLAPRQPVSEGLTRYAETDSGMRAVEKGTYGCEYYFADEVDARLSATPPAKAEGMSDTEIGVIGALIELAARAYDLMDNSEERGPVGASELLVQRADFDNLSAALDVLDQLPDDRPGYVLSGPARAAWALRGILVQQDNQGGGQ